MRIVTTKVVKRFTVSGVSMVEMMDAGIVAGRLSHGNEWRW